MRKLESHATPRKELRQEIDRRSPAAKLFSETAAGGRKVSEQHVTADGKLCPGLQGNGAKAENVNSQGLDEYLL